MMDFSNLAFRVEPMQLSDVQQVMEIEHVSFTAPWSASAYERELVYNDNAHFFVVRPQADPALPDQTASLTRGWLRNLFRPNGSPISAPNPQSIVGYGGFWLTAGEAHIMTIAVKPDFRGKHVGELLLAAMIDGAGELNASEVTLEVRVTNHVAQALYRKYGFMEAGRRLRYYSDNGEDALIMTTSPLRSPGFLRQFEILKRALGQRMVRQ